MCLHEIIHENKFGYLISCADCDHYQLGFGNVLLTLPSHSLEKIREVFCKMYEKLERNEKSTLFDGRESACATPFENLQFTFYKAELEEVIELLSWGCLRSDAIELLSRKNVN